MKTYGIGFVKHNDKIIKIRCIDFDDKLLKYKIRILDANQFYLTCNVYKTKQGELQTKNGTIDRYNFYDINFNLLSKSLSIFILGKTVNKDFYITDGISTTKVEENKIIECCKSKMIKIANGKIVNGSFISSIIDEYDELPTLQARSFELYTDLELQKYIKNKVPESVKYERTLMSDLENYINNNESGKVCLLNGLRRTGKTILLLQLAKKLLDKNKKGAYILCNNSSNIQELKDVLKELQNKEYDFIFIDEITSVRGFYENANVLSDSIAIGKTKIILSGTDSLIFSATKIDSLYGRYTEVSTTYIGYKEYCKLFKSIDILEYLRIGGTLQVDTFYKETHDYIDTSIINNIVHTLQKIKELGTYPNIRFLLQKDEKLLRKAIFQLLIYENEQLLYTKLNADFILPEFESTFNLMLGYIKDFGEQQKEEIYNELINKYQIEKDTSKQIVDSLISELLEILQQIDVITKYNRRLRDSGKKDLEVKEVYLFNQPGLRYSLTEDLIKQIYTKFSNEDQTKLESFEKRLRFYLEGSLLEHQTINNFLHNPLYANGYEITQITKNPGEYDIAVMNTNTKTVDVYEVKRSKDSKKEWSQWMNNSDFVKYVQSQINYKIQNKTVLYNGEDAVVNGVPYKNISKFLKI